MTDVYLNGEFVALEQASVPVLDRGFLFGDGVYEVIPVYNGHLFRLQEHLRRLDNSLSGIRMENPMDTDRWRQCLDELIQRHGGGDLSVYIQVTRGVGQRRDHAIAEAGEPTVLAMASPLVSRDDPTVKACTCEDIRWKNCQIKAITLLANVLLRQQAMDAGFDEAILVRDGWITEGSTSNVFAVADGVVLTPPKGPHLLPGITRDVVLELLATAGIASDERHFDQALLAGADEIWLTSSTREIMPVLSLNNQPVGSGETGPVCTRVMALFADFKAAVASGG